MLFAQVNEVDGIVLLVTVVTTLFIYLRNKDRRALPYPPGPKKLPFIGSLLYLPRSYPWETYAQWAEELSTPFLVDLQQRLRCDDLHRFGYHTFPCC